MPRSRRRPSSPGNLSYDVHRVNDRNETYSINVTSVHFTTFALLPLLAAAKDVGGASEPGNVINISSISGLTHTAQGGQFSYNSSKGAVAHISRMMATEFARRGLGIRVNAIAPGYFPSVITPSQAELTSAGHVDVGLHAARVRTGVALARRVRHPAAPRRECNRLCAAHSEPLCCRC